MKGLDFVPKSDVRQLIKVSKEPSKRVNHPHARYNQLGRISCIVCGVQIKSEHAWNAHILSKTHKQNESRELQAPRKRPAEPEPSSTVPIKKPVSTDDVISKPPVAADQHHVAPNAPIPQTVDLVSLGEKNPAEKTRAEGSGSKLPEGFFDDRYKDAKVRNVPYKDKLAEEVEIFQKEMIALEKQSEDIMEKESEAMVSGRELEEIDTQIQKWEKIKQLQTEIEVLESRRRENRTPADPVADEKSKNEIKVKEEPSDSDSDDVDGLYDFRTKNII